MKYQAFFIKLLTNMHAGSGDANYGIVDKLVQRDPVTGLPTVNASSLKGALREHFEQKNSTKVKIDEIFGKEAKGNNDETAPGDFTFTSADLVTIPVRSNFLQFFPVVNKKQLKYLNDKAKILVGYELFDTCNLNNNNEIFYQEGQPGYDVYLEEFKVLNKNAHIKLFKNNNKTAIDSFNERFATLNNKAFETVTKNLPVIARNHLENGKSQNLWYEEIVPHQTVFLTFIGMPDDYSGDFVKELTEDIVQIGGNATIGYGLCKFYKVDFNNQENQSS